MVPNSLGPGELLSHYGTTEQKDYWLPRLAHGDEIPCFALTGLEQAQMLEAFLIVAKCATAILMESKCSGLN